MTICFLMTFLVKLQKLVTATTKSRAIDISQLKGISWHHFATLFSMVLYRVKIKYIWQLRNGRVISGNCIIDYLLTELFLFIKMWNSGVQEKQCRCNRKPQGNTTSKCTAFSSSLCEAEILVALPGVFGQNQWLMSKNCPSALFGKSDLRNDQIKVRPHNLVYLS